MKRRTLRQLQPADHHSVYVVLLDSAVGKIRKVRAVNPDRDRKQPCVYVGMTGLTPKERFANHKAGIKDARVVHRYGLRPAAGILCALEPDAVYGGSNEGCGFGGGSAPGRLRRPRWAFVDCDGQTRLPASQGRTHFVRFQAATCMRRRA